MEGRRPRRGALVLVSLVALVVAVGAVVLVRSHHSTPAPVSAPPASVTPSPTPTPTPSPKAVAPPSPSPTAKPARGPCSTGTVEPFDPATIRVPGVQDVVHVITPPREGGVPGTPPLTSEGKHLFAFDTAQGVAPGDLHGNVLLNAHTWPDGTALGNQLLAGLHVGDRLVVRGTDRGSHLCYRVSQRLEVLAADGYAPYYSTKGPPQLAIIVCSGTRLGPGQWTKRTIWFARVTA